MAIREADSTHLEAEDLAASPCIVPSRYQVGLIVVLGAIFLIGLAPKIDTDLWWHLRDGSFIAAHHTVLSRDPYSFTFAGKSWTNHEWLTELLFYGLYRLAGLWGPIVFFAGIICATFALVYATMVQRQGVNRILALFVLVAAFVASSSTWGARPQMLSLFFLAVYGLALERFRCMRDWRWLIILPAAMLLWTNLHGGWALGLVLIGITLLGEVINRLTHREDPLSPGELRLLGAALVLTLLATLINPNGFQQVTYPLVWIFPSAYSNVLNEWVSVDFHQPVYMVFEAMVLGLIAAFYLSRSRLNWTHLLLVLAFTHLALSQSRNVAVWSIVVSPLLAFYLQQAIDARKSGKAVVRDNPRLLSPARERSLNLTLLVLTSLLYVVEAFHFISPAALQRSEAANYPRGAVQYMQTHRLPPNTFASYAWGGYLIWNLYPRYRDFIDGRANTVFDSTILFAYLDAYSAAPDWQSALSRWNVENVLIDPGAPLAQVLVANKGWRRVYQDSTAVLFTRR